MGLWMGILNVMEKKAIFCECCSIVCRGKMSSIPLPLFELLEYCCLVSLQSSVKNFNEKGSVKTEGQDKLITKPNIKYKKLPRTCKPNGGQLSHYPASQLATGLVIYI